MLEQLDHAWLRLNAFCAHPVVALISILVCTLWFVASKVTTLDPGMTVGSYVVNAIQLVLLFVAANAAHRGMTHAAKAHAHAKRAAEVNDAHLDAMRAAIRQITEPEKVRPRRRLS